jgi:hypothetical protein
LKNLKYLLMGVFILTTSISLLWGESFEEAKNNKGIGLLLGDPMVVSVKLPIKERNFLDFRAGLWTWHFWHDQKYDTPYLSIDYGWFFPLKESPHYFYVGTGVALFFSDNPKDTNDYDTCAAVRFPIGRELYNNGEDFSVVFEAAPIYQFAPAYDAKPYIFELNAGIMLRHSF